MAIYHADELPELTDLNAINRSVPAMPSGMEKEEESEKHLQDILDAQNDREKRELAESLVIPTPEVFEGENEAAYLQLYKEEYKVYLSLFFLWLPLLVTMLPSLPSFL